MRVWTNRDIETHLLKLLPDTIAAGSLNELGSRVWFFSANPDKTSGIDRDMGMEISGWDATDPTINFRLFTADDDKGKWGKSFELPCDPTAEEIDGVDWNAIAEYIKGYILDGKKESNNPNKREESMLSIKTHKKFESKVARSTQRRPFRSKAESNVDETTFKQAVDSFIECAPSGGWGDYWEMQQDWAAYIDGLCRDGSITQRQYDNFSNPCTPETFDRWQKRNGLTRRSGGYESKTHEAKKPEAKQPEAKKSEGADGKLSVLLFQSDDYTKALKAHDALEELYLGLMDHIKYPVHVHMVEPTDGFGTYEVRASGKREPVLKFLNLYKDNYRKEGTPFYEEPSGSMWTEPADLQGYFNESKKPEAKKPEANLGKQFEVLTKAVLHCCDNLVKDTSLAGEFDDEVIYTEDAIKNAVESMQTLGEACKSLKHVLEHHKNEDNMKVIGILSDAISQIVSDEEGDEANAEGEQAQDNEDSVIDQVEKEYSGTEEPAGGEELTSDGEPGEAPNPMGMQEPEL